MSTPTEQTDASATDVSTQVIQTDANDSVTADGIVRTQPTQVQFRKHDYIHR